MPGSRAAGAVCVVLRGVSPARWEACQRVLTELQRCANEAGVVLPLTLLVEPRSQGEAALPLRYLHWLRGLAGAGHELALHGMSGKGEFAALEHAQAAQSLREGRAWARDQGLPMDGFVATARLPAAALQAMADAGFRHTCTATEVIALPHRQALPAPTLVFGTRTPWRRGLSLAWNRLRARRARAAPLLRLELHPGAGEHRAVLHCWTELLGEALRTRTPLLLSEAAQMARRA